MIAQRTDKRRQLASLMFSSPLSPHAAPFRRTRRLRAREGQQLRGCKGCGCSSLVSTDHQQHQATQPASRFCFPNSVSSICRRSPLFFSSRPSSQSFAARPLLTGSIVLGLLELGSCFFFTRTSKAKQARTSVPPHTLSRIGIRAASSRLILPTACHFPTVVLSRKHSRYPEPAPSGPQGS